MYKTPGVENTENWGILHQVFSTSGVFYTKKNLLFSAKRGKNTKNGVENTGVEYPTFFGG